MSITRIHLFILFVAFWTGNKAQSQTFSPLSLENGRLVYQADELGNRIPDFSYAGYMAGEKPIPNAPIKIVVPQIKGDATSTIQASLNYVASLPLDENGIRGVVLLERGIYEIWGSLGISASGVILRGSGMHEDGTVLIGMGNSRETLIKVSGKYDLELKDEVAITNEYVPVNATRFKVVSDSSFKEGDNIIIRRPSTEEWIKELGMDEFGGGINWLGWEPGRRDLIWDRTISKIDDNVITVDAPITNALDEKYGGGYIASYQWPGRISQVAVENIRLKSIYDLDNSKNEDHRWMAITMENVVDAWVRQVVFEHFAGSAVALFETAKSVTVEDCKSLAPISEIGGGRRQIFYTAGQQTLFQRCYSEYGYHDFAVGFRASGPNAFVQCENYLPYSFSGPIDSWATGVLFDMVNIDGEELGFQNRGQDGQGAGWTGANSVLWQSTAAKILNFKPPTANNWSFGSWGQFAGNGYWESSNDFVNPRSLYYAQLAERLGEDVWKRAHLKPLSSGSTSPSIEEATEFMEESLTPPILLSNWIDSSTVFNSIPILAQNIKRAKLVEPEKVDKDLSESVKVVNGWLTHSGKVLTGSHQGVRWWRGDVRYYEIEKAAPHVTRYIPGRYGKGLTDNLEEVTQWMDESHVALLDHNYGLWYDRRRDDHERVRRQDGEVWPPFYELPFARSGKGFAWDGLSKYDLTKYNPWYWNRLKEFSDLAEKRGLILIHQNYFQHNILEAGAHWTDFPWRTANNINNTGFPEPPPYAGDKRIFMSELFYDVDHEKRRQLHQAYIRKCMDNFKQSSNVIQFISAEYTGPLAFTEFWIDTILEWEKENDNKAYIGLSTTKDVQDSILADKSRSDAIDLIDIRYWHYRKDGSLYAPLGGQHLAPRQHARLVDPGETSFEQVYRAVREYRAKFPEKPVMYSADQGFGWAVFLAGGSLANIPEVKMDDFLSAATHMEPLDYKSPVGQWFIGSPEKGIIGYVENSGTIEVDLTNHKGKYWVLWINPENGETLKKDRVLKGGERYNVYPPVHGSVIIWISKR